MQFDSIFVLVFLSGITLTLGQHPAICFVQNPKSFKIAEPLLYSESYGALMLSPRGKVFTIRCTCPTSEDDRTLEIQINDGSIADPLICPFRVRAVMNNMAESSSSSGAVSTSYIGFEIWESAIEKLYFVPVVEIAFNKVLRTPVYVKYRYRSPNLNHLMFWSSVNYQPNHENEKNPSLYGNHDLDTLYEYDYQMSLFSPFVDDDYYEELFEDSKPILEKQQLAQHNDFLLASWKEVTYFDANTAPIFKDVQFTWQKIELFVVNVAKVLKRHLFITTGVAMIKTFIDSRGIRIPIYLNRKTTPPSSPVPEIFWKSLLYTNVTDDEAITYGLLVIMHNDPLYGEDEHLCSFSEDVSIKEWNDLFETADDQESKKIAYICELNKENLKKLRLPVSLPTAENFLDVEELRARFETDNFMYNPVFRFV